MNYRIETTVHGLVDALEELKTWQHEDAAERFFEFQYYGPGDWRMTLFVEPKLAPYCIDSNPWIATEECETAFQAFVRVSEKWNSVIDALKGAEAHQRELDAQGEQREEE